MQDTEIARKNGHARALNGTHAPAAKTEKTEEFPYVFPYDPQSVYGHFVGLARRYVAPGALVDLGAGAGTVGAPLAAAGFDYVAVEQDDSALRLLDQRGIRNYRCNIADLTRLATTLDAVPGARAYCLLDVIEHLEHPEAVLSFLSSYALEHGAPYLIISVPNVGHRDVAYSLLAGHWDTTDTGLLDRTHLHFFATSSLHRLCTESGWQLVARDDYTQPQSDQYDPASILHRDSLLNDFLHDVSDTFNPDSTVNQFVWVLKPTGIGMQETRETEENADTAVTASPLLSLLVRTQGTRNDLLTEALYSIYAQDCDDYEVVVCHHSPGAVDQAQQKALRDLFETLPARLQAKIRMIECIESGRSAPLNALVDAAHGTYLGFLDDDDLLFPRHVSTLQRGVEAYGVSPIYQVYGARRTISVRKAKKEQHKEFGFAPERPTNGRDFPSQTYPYATDRIQPYWIVPYSPVTQQYRNDIPNCCMLLPRTLFEQTNLRFRVDFELAEDWEFLMRASHFLHVVTLPEITTAINVRDNDSNTVQKEDLRPGWFVAHSKRLDEQAKRPILLEGRTARLLYRTEVETQTRRDEVVREAEAMRSEHLELRDWAHNLEKSLQEARAEHEKLLAWARGLEQHAQSSSSNPLIRITQQIRARLGRK